MMREPYKPAEPVPGASRAPRIGPRLTTYAARAMPPTGSSLCCPGCSQPLRRRRRAGRPDGGDVPAHLYRTLLVHQNVYLWDNLWFAGQYPLVSACLPLLPGRRGDQDLTLVVGALHAQQHHALQPPAQ